ncbi:valine--tRNA ligase [Leadbetterella sp. DM7]|uniref:valine--tRNA ligase n=1 Tax=Leadbetterella sp. DM7 TaxID=3235085 RepID=UPI00349E8057
MELSKTYSPKEVEDKWYAYWEKNKFFSSKPNPRKEPYTVVIPPPNVTGVLHMGHMLNNTIQDVLVRKARMEGKETCWVPGTDHASIATEAKVVAMLKEKGINKADLSREEFLKYCWEWTEKYGGIILKQLRKLGASCDWDRTRFTMEPSLYDAVIDVFVDLYNKGEIYRGYRMVNWDPEARTTVSDEEVITKEMASRLVYIRYFFPGSTDGLTIATTRPETIMADAAICVNPNDDRYRHLVGKTVLIPLINKEIRVIADEYVETDFGTGCLKVTPAHDQNDFILGEKHGLEVIDILTDDAKLSEKAQILVGEDRFVARKKIIKMLEESGNLVKVEDYKSNVGTSERTGAVIEPKISLQWFLKMKEISKPAWENVMNDTIRLIPPKFKNTYNHWMENVRDWNISRQLWWGHRIPAYYLGDGTVIVAKSLEEAVSQAREKGLNVAAEDFTQDEDVLDTWFSSWLWPISVFDGFKDPENEDIRYYYPTNDLVTAPEILFFWVARMIIAGYEYKGTYPFKNVYLTGIVRDKLGRKMSKSLGNSPDPLDLIDQYGADAVRTGMLFSSPAGNDLPYDEKLVEQGRNFSNKIWNAFRLVKGWETGAGEVPVAAIKWFRARLNAAIAEVREHYEKFRMSDALLTTYNLIWNDFCSQYLEMVKPAYADGVAQPVAPETYNATIGFFDELMRLAHPWIPFISEEIWQSLADRSAGDSICIQPFPKGGEADAGILGNFEILSELVSWVRNTRQSKQISPKESLPLEIRTTAPERYRPLEPLIMKLANIGTITYAHEVSGMTYVIKGDEFGLDLGGNLDTESEKENLQKELEYTLGFKKSVEAKLSNEKFVANAKPEVVEREKAKLADADAKIQAIREALQKL